MPNADKSMMAGVLYGAHDLRLEPRQRPVLAKGMVLLRVVRAGICGSDLHYFEHGNCGAFVPTKPFVLGHEAVGIVEEAAEGVRSPEIGSRVAVNPARICGVCHYCRQGRGNLCRSTIMLGSASTNPPTDGAFADYVLVRGDQCHVLPPEIDNGLGAMLEPFAVALHAVKRAVSVSGERVLVTGGGPIGLLVLITSIAFGASMVVLSDPIAGRRQAARRFKADDVIDPAEKGVGDAVRRQVGEGFDVIFEASGSSPALRQAFGFVRPGGKIIQIGTLSAGDIPLPANQVMSREIEYLGSFRYGDVFDEAIRLVGSGRVDLRPLITAVWPMAKISDAVRDASSKDGAIKVQIDPAGENRP
jgi:L-idonate 5-dehydrogenase